VAASAPLGIIKGSEIVQEEAMNETQTENIKQYDSFEAAKEALEKERQSSRSF
jgi:hypothetical protein